MRREISWVGLSVGSTVVTTAGTTAEAGALNAVARLDAPRAATGTTGLTVTAIMTGLTARRATTGFAVTAATIP